MERPTGPPPTASGTVVIMTAVIGVACVAFLFLAVLLGPVLLQIAGLGIAFAMFGGLHYWLWGRSMPQTPDEPPPE